MRSVKRGSPNHRKIALTRGEIGFLDVYRTIYHFRFKNNYRRPEIIILHEIIIPREMSILREISTIKMSSKSRIPVPSTFKMWLCKTRVRNSSNLKQCLLKPSAKTCVLRLMVFAFDSLGVCVLMA